MWDPAQYLAFSDVRLRPALELLARVGWVEPTHVVDAGCGPGTVTAHLRRRWPSATITAIDHDPAMLERAGREVADVVFVDADLSAWEPIRPVDVVYSNATLHWLDDHETLFPRIARWLTPGGTLAVQMPDQHREPSHAVATEMAHEEQWSNRLVPLLRNRAVADTSVYRKALAPVCSELDIWHVRYEQVLTGADPVVEFTNGSVLRPLLAALDHGERTKFLRRYTESMREAYPPQADGSTVFPFVRLFIVAVR